MCVGFRPTRFIILECTKREEKFFLLILFTHDSNTKLTCVLLSKTKPRWFFYAYAIKFERVRKSEVGGAIREKGTGGKTRMRKKKT